MEWHLVFLKVDEQICDESQCLLFHESIHIFLANLDPCYIDALHLTFISNSKKSSLYLTTSNIVLSLIFIQNKHLSYIQGGFSVSVMGSGLIYYDYIKREL